MASKTTMITVVNADPERFKISKRAAGYQDTPRAGRCCRLCFRFRKQKCTAVEGFIFEDGYCRYAVPPMQQWVEELHEKGRLDEAARAEFDREDRLPADREPSAAG
jgi:hypothetical protein